MKILGKPKKNYKVILTKIEVKGSKAKKKITLASGNASDEKNLRPGGRNFFFLINLI